MTRLVPNQTAPTIGDRLSEKGISWAWFSGGVTGEDGGIALFLALGAGILLILFGFALRRKTA